MFSFEKPDNLVELMASSIEKHADRPLFGTPDDNGDYHWVTYRQIGQRIDALRAGLAKLGVTSGDAVGVIANNRVEWVVAAFATFGLGGRFIPMYENELARIWQHIIHDGNIKVLFVANQKIFDKIQAIRAKLPSLEHVLVIDGDQGPNMTRIEAQGRKQPVSAICPSPDDIAVLIYTSGTTGKPKGVSSCLSHHRASPVVDRFDALVVVPMAHLTISHVSECTGLTRLGSGHEQILVIFDGQRSPSIHRKCQNHNTQNTQQQDNGSSLLNPHVLPSLTC